MTKTKIKSSQEKIGTTTIIRSGANGNPRVPILIATPTLGIVRMEWSVARYGQIIPCNWTNHDVTVGIGSTVPMHYLVADGQNIATEHLLQGKQEWLLLYEDDVVPPMDTFLRLDEYIQKATIPVVSGLYFLKVPRSEPVCYRGHGTRCFHDFKLGDKFWVDGVPTGMLLIHRSILQLMYDESEPYKTMGGRVVRKVFETPAKMAQDPSTGTWSKLQGTSDLHWCKRVIKEGVLKRAGWGSIAKKQYPFLVDSNIFCRHIDLSTGHQFPDEPILKLFRKTR
jgi:hypothetical protein